MPADEKELKTGLVRQVIRLASYLPELLELVGTPSPVARAVRHAVRMVPAVRNEEVSVARDAMEELVDGRFVSLLESHEELDERFRLLEQEHIKIKNDLADTATQLQGWRAETMRLKTEIESLRQRNFYLALGVLAVFIAEIATLAWKFVR
jgi:uncharacterized protein YdcH (DUF465 family)